MDKHEYRASEDVRAHVTSVIPRRESVFVDHELSADEAALVALGYKQEFKREFSVWTSFGVSFSVLGLLPSTASTLYVKSSVQSLLTDSMVLVMLARLAWLSRSKQTTDKQVWGWIIAMLFIQCVAMSMAELCSSMPTSVNCFGLHVLTSGWSLLRFGGPGTSRLGSLCSLAYWLVQLDCPSHWRTFRGLRYFLVREFAD